jgi:hypothetical protein
MIYVRPTQPLTAGSPAGGDVMARYIITGGPWPERIGLIAHIVEPPEGELQYPWDGVMKNEAVVSIEDDPHTPAERSWSCVMRRSHLTSEGAYSLSNPKLTDEEISAIEASRGGCRE